MAGDDERGARVTLGNVHDIDDELLASLNVPDATAAHVPLPAPDEFRGGRALPDDAPFDVEVARPRAVDVTRLYALAKRRIPDEIAAALGPSRPILLCHAVTPFHRHGARVSDVWGLGYEAKLEGVTADTVGFRPGSETVTVGSVEQKLSFGVGAGGELSLPEEAVELANAIPGLRVEGGEICFSTDSRFAIGISLKLTLRAVQAGPVGAGGVRWNIYRQKDRLDEVQALFQTLLVPKDAKNINVSVQSWVRTKGFLGFGSKQWSSEWERFEVSLVRE
jgi:hypothetical protein